jgi:hypothetical protein
MQSVGFAVRLLPGQAGAVRVALASCWSGARKEAYQDARRRAGIIREAVWIQPGPGGDVAVVYLEADDLAAAFTILGSSAEPFDRWFRDHAGQVHGMTQAPCPGHPSGCAGRVHGPDCAALIPEDVSGSKAAPRRGEPVTLASAVHPLIE